MEDIDLILVHDDVIKWNITLLPTWGYDPSDRLAGGDCNEGLHRFLVVVVF